MNHIKKINNWLVWKYVQKEVGKKPSKVPFTIDGRPREIASPLASYDAALRAVEIGGYDGIGFALTPGCGVVALDFDNCVDMVGNIDPRVERLCDGTYTEYSPSGTGLRAFYVGNLPSRKDTKAERGLFALEVFGDSGFVTVTGNATVTCQVFGCEEVVAPVSQAVLAEYEARGWAAGAGMGAGMGGGEADSTGLMALEPTLGWTLAYAREVLTDCDPSAGRDQWLKALMAMHHEFSGSDEALAIVDEWSAKGENYGGTRDVEGRWRSFGRGNVRGVTGRWLLKWRSECNTHKRYSVVDGLKAKILEASDEFSLREQICHEIKKADLDEMGREALAQVLCDKLRALGTRYPIAQCRKLIEPVRAQRAVGDTPEWCQPWVYVTDRDKFYKMDSEEWLTIQSFNATFNREMPKDEDGAVAKSAAWAALEDFCVPSVTRGMYIPWARAMFAADGVQCVNVYRPSSVPKADSLSPVGNRVLERFKKHLSTLFGGREHVVELLLDWIAHNVQKPGIKIRWAPLIKGMPGDGKTLIGTMLEAVMGKPNIKQISPNVLATDFTDWAHNACIGVMEEIKLTGHNRYDILNKLKPYITNNTVTVHPKGQAEYNLPNTMNYIAFTNFADAIPMEETDRRWFTIHSPFNTKEDLLEAFGGEQGAKEHFDDLYDGIAAHRGELRGWFEERVIAASFKPNGTAPVTEERATMISLTMSPEEETLREIIERGAYGVDKLILSSVCLTEEALNEEPTLNLNTTHLNRYLAKLGFIKFKAKVRWGGRVHRVWFKSHRNLTGDKIKDLLDKTSVKMGDLFQ